MDINSDQEWKSQVGFPINYESGQSSDDDFDTSDVVLRRHQGSKSSHHLLADAGDGAAADLLGTTPPRARIRDKEKRRSNIDSDACLQRVFKDNRRNTVDNFYNMEDSPEPPERIKKRASLKLRTRERDRKQSGFSEHRADSLPSPTPPPNLPTLVESCNRFMSLTSRLKCSDLRAPPEDPPAADELPPSRVNFHQTFSMLINMGNVEKGCRRGISREEQVWQNELKDLIWLELQAKIAERTLAQQDYFLCKQRKIVPTIIHNIMEYRFINPSTCKSRVHPPSGSNGGVSPEPAGNNEPFAKEEEQNFYGCLSFTCRPCWDAVGRALQQLGTLLDSIHNALALYPSSKAMTLDHPTMSTPQFNNRLKAMCLWYNTALHMRLKVLAMRTFLRSIQEKVRRNQRRPTATAEPDAPKLEPRPCQVRFNINGEKTPTDSSNSDSSSASNGQRETAAKKERDELDSPQERSVPSTPEIVISDNMGTTDTTISFESGYQSDARRQTSETPSSQSERAVDSDGRGGSPEEDVFNMGCLQDVTSLRLLNQCKQSPYRSYHHEVLKTQGVRRSMMFIHKMRQHFLNKIYVTFLKPDNKEYSESEISDVFEEKEGDDVEMDSKEIYEMRRYGCRSPETISMRLPSYRSHMLLLSSICMEVVHDYLSLRLDACPANVSPLTVKQMNHELREGMDIATNMRISFVKNIEVAIDGYPAEPEVKDDLILLIRTFDATLDAVLKQYLTYLKAVSEVTHVSRAVLEAEWAFTAQLANKLPAAAELAPPTFTDIVCFQIDLLLRQLDQKFKGLMQNEEQINDANIDFDTKRHLVYALCREAQNIYSSERKVTLQTVQFARTLAAKLSRANQPAFCELRERIFVSVMSVRQCIVKQTLLIVERSSAALSDEPSERAEGLHARLRELLLQVYKLGFELHKELHSFVHSAHRSARELPRQRPASLQPVRAETVAMRRRRPETVLIHESFNPMVHKELHRFVSDASERARLPSAGGRRPSGSAGPRPRLLRSESRPDDADDGLRADDLTGFAVTLPSTSIEQLLSPARPVPGTSPGVAAAESATAGEECHVQKEFARQVSRAIIEFANCWMRFVMAVCERGRGLRPRWACQGLEFLMLACDPYNTKHLSDKEFEELKQLMDGCISHVIGSRPARELVASPTPRRPRQRLHSPMSTSSTTSSRDAPPTPLSPNSPSVETDPMVDLQLDGALAHSKRVLDAIQRLDGERDAGLRVRTAIGRCVETAPTSYEPKLRQLTFKWQRGLKIGQGSFGKVYTVINTESGQLLAMKEISISANDRRALMKAANELRVLEGIVHPHLVRYYGLEIHREEMLLFMELCVEGSLESLLVSSGALPEHAVRRYTKQLLSAVQELHSKGIAHRDIKSGNIFLTREGNCIKLGDFGCAVKIRANTTVQGELQGCVGTQAYMAPEVFMKSSGHGRAADIWSLGCVVTEMASGKRPFPEYDSNYQIMFVVGMGGRPEIPPSLSEEGASFCRACLTHEAEARPRAHDLSDHHFLMVKTDDDCGCEPGFLMTKL